MTRKSQKAPACCKGTSSRALTAIAHCPRFESGQKPPRGGMEKGKRRLGTRDGVLALRAVEKRTGEVKASEKPELWGLLSDPIDSCSRIHPSKLQAFPGPRSQRPTQVLAQPQCHSGTPAWVQVLSNLHPWFSASRYRRNMYRS